MALLIDPAHRCSPAETLALQLKPKYLPDVRKRFHEVMGGELCRLAEKVDAIYERIVHPYLLKQINAAFSPEEIQIGVDHSHLFKKNQLVLQQAVNQFTQMAMILAQRRVNQEGLSTSLEGILRDMRQNGFDCPANKTGQLPLAMKYAKLLDEHVGSITRSNWDQLMEQMGREMDQSRKNSLGDHPVFDQIFGGFTVRWVRECKDLFPAIREELTKCIAIALINEHSEADLMALSALSTSQVTSRYLQKWGTLATQIEADMDRLFIHMAQAIALEMPCDGGSLRQREMCD